MEKLLNINRVWIEFISKPPSSDRYCNRLWKQFKWEVLQDDDKNYIINSVYHFGKKDDNMKTWTEPFGTSVRFDKWVRKAKKFLQKSFPNSKIKYKGELKDDYNHIIFKIK